MNVLVKSEMYLPKLQLFNKTLIVFKIIMNVFRQKNHYVHMYFILKT